MVFLQWLFAMESQLQITQINTIHILHLSISNLASEEHFARDKGTESVPEMKEKASWH